jgi:N-acetylneuraminic acid mutarotase
MPVANGGFIGGVLGEDLVVAGGTNWKDGTKHWLDGIWAFDTTRKAWREAGHLATPCAYAAHGTDAQGIFFASGRRGEKAPASLEKIDLPFTVQTIARDTPAVVSCASALLDSELWIIGGSREAIPDATMTNACFAIDTRTGKTRRLADLPVPSFSSGAAAVCGGRIFVFGGARWDPATNAVANLRTTFAWSAQAKRWEALAPYPFAARGCTAVALDERFLYIAGGYNNDLDGFTAEACLFDTKHGQFKKAKALPHRAITTLLRSGDFIYCLGGEDQKKHRSAAVWRISSQALLDAP